MPREPQEMKHILSFGIAFLLSARLATTQGYNPELQELAQTLKPGMTNQQAEEIISRYSRQFAWNWSGKVGRPALSRYQLDDDTYVILRYETTRDPIGNIADEDKLTSFEMVSLQDLRSRLPKGALEGIRLIHQAPSPMACGFDPTKLIRAVNRLQEIGSRESVRLLRLYHDLASYDDGDDSDWRWRYDLDEQRIFLILRLLFVRKDGESHMPWMHSGATLPAIPKENTDWPLFPLAVSGDIPFFMANGYGLGGVPESPLRHLDYCEQNCVIRQEPMSPSLLPIQAVAALYRSERWKELFGAYRASPFTPNLGWWAEYELRLQAIRCFPYGMDVPGKLEGELNPGCGGHARAEQAWRECLRRLSEIKLAWDSDGCKFHVAK